jgi:hypothetical protein
MTSPSDIGITQQIKMKIEIMSPVDAGINGYTSLTTPYDQSNQQEVEWMKSVVQDLKGCSIVLIDTPTGYEVARHKTEIIPPNSSR